MDKKLYASSYYDVKVNKYGVKVGTSLRFLENKGWINSIDPYGWFQWYCRYWLGRRSSDDERQIKRWRAIVNRFKNVLVKMIKDKGAKFDDYSVSPKIRQILLHWGYELVERDCFRCFLSTCRAEQKFKKSFHKKISRPAPGLGLRL